MSERPENLILTVRGTAKTEVLHIIETADTDGENPGMRFLSATRVEVTDPARALEGVTDDLSIREGNLADTKYLPASDPWKATEQRRRSALRDIKLQIETFSRPSQD